MNQEWPRASELEPVTVLRIRKSCKASNDMLESNQNVLKLKSKLSKNKIKVWQGSVGNISIALQKGTHRDIQGRPQLGIPIDTNSQ